jgi:hypothetical protein
MVKIIQEGVFYTILIDDIVYIDQLMSYEVQKWLARLEAERAARIG